jgi:hypothetical protein
MTVFLVLSAALTILNVAKTATFQRRCPGDGKGVITDIEEQKKPGKRNTPFNSGQVKELEFVGEIESGLPWRFLFR